MVNGQLIALPTRQGIVVVEGLETIEGPSLGYDKSRLVPRDMIARKLEEPVGTAHEGKVLTSFSIAL